jgi:S-adenosylmethionine decarboxylase proenzyme
MLRKKPAKKKSRKGAKKEMDYVSEVTQHVRLKESKKIVEQFLILLYLQKSASTKSLSAELLLPIPVVTAIKKEFIKLGVVAQQSGISLTDRGIQYVEDDMKYAGLNVALYNKLLSDRITKSQYMRELEFKIASIYENRPQVNVTLDQAFATAEMAIKRAILCVENFTLIGKSVLCVGDDDLVSVALSFLLRDLFPGNDEAKSRIVVFDVDKGMLDYISEIGTKHKFAIECHSINLRSPLPLKFLNAFDCFFTDPPYTQDGMLLFLSRGVGALKQEKGNSIFLSFAKKPLEENLKIQQEIINHGLSIKAIVDSFNEYYGASLLGNRSQMLVLESTESTKMLINSDSEYTKPIYTRETNPRERQYRCKNCDYLVFMSAENDTEFQTIEQLKSAGCPKCNNSTFHLLIKNQHITPIEEKKHLGTHIIADFFDCCEEVLKDTELIRNYMIRAVEKANATIVSENFNSFNPWGVSGVIVIQESHFTIHTWPEFRYSAVDLFTCGTDLELLEALEYLKKQLKCATMEHSSLLRGLFRDNRIVSTVSINN